MINKVFLQLVGELRQLGATIVSACFNRLVLCTGKDNVDTAKQYLDYLLNTIVEKPLFSKVRFIRRGWWRCMLYKDRANFGGIRMAVQNDGDEPVVEEDGSLSQQADGQEEDDRVELHFNVSRYLPEDLQLYFTRVLAEFIQEPVKRARSLAQEQASLGGGALPAAAVEAQVNAALGEAVSTTLTRQMCRFVQAIENRYPTVATTTYPQLPGRAEKPPQTAALEFVKTVTFVMGAQPRPASRLLKRPSARLPPLTCGYVAAGLDAATETPVARMRKTLLQLLKLNEFSKQVRPPPPSRPSQCSRLPGR